MNTGTDPDFQDRLVNEREAAAFLCYTVRALQNWRVRGGGPKFIKVSSRSVRYTRRDLNEWIAARKISNTAQFAIARASLAALHGILGPDGFKTGREVTSLRALSLSAITQHPNKQETKI